MLEVVRREDLIYGLVRAIFKTAMTGECQAQYR
jgi:hypothetical protein